MSHLQQPTNFSIEKLLCDDNGSYDNSNTPSKIVFKQKQRRRSSFTAIQVHWLEAEFRCHRYVSPERRAGLAALLGLTQQQIKIWFQNRRYKTKFRQGNNIPPHLPDCSHFTQRSNNNNNNNNNTFYQSQQTNQDLYKLLNRQNLWNNYCVLATSTTTGNGTMPQTKSENKIPKIDYSTQSQNHTQ